MKTILFDDDFTYAKKEEKISAASSTIFPDDIPDEKSNKLWQEPGGSANGFPFWLNYYEPTDEAYMTENPHVSPQDPERIYYYSGIMLKNPLTLKMNKEYMWETRWWIDDWFGYTKGLDPALGEREDGCTIHKIELGLLSMTYPSVLFDSAFNQYGGGMAIRLDDGINPEQVLSGQSWDWKSHYQEFLNRFSDTYHTRRHIVRLTESLVSFTFQLIDNTEVIYEQSVAQTSDEALIQTLRITQPWLAYIIIPQIKGNDPQTGQPYIDENVGLHKFSIIETDL